MTPSDHQVGEVKGFFPNTTTTNASTDADNTSHHRTVNKHRAVRSRPGSESEADHSTCVCETETDTGTESDDSGGGNADADGLDDDDDALLPKTCGGTVVYNAIALADNGDDDDTDRTVCNRGGSYRRVPVMQAREEADRYCRACAAQQEGTDRRPCPYCDRLIGVTYWPQHVRQCNGTHKHPNRRQP